MEKYKQRDCPSNSQGLLCCEQSGCYHYKKNVRENETRIIEPTSRELRLHKYLPTSEKTPIPRRASVRGQKIGNDEQHNRREPKFVRSFHLCGSIRLINVTNHENFPGIKTRLLWPAGQP